MNHIEWIWMILNDASLLTTCKVALQRLMPGCHWNWMQNIAELNAPNASSIEAWCQSQRCTTIGLNEMRMGSDHPLCDNWLMVNPTSPQKRYGMGVNSKPDPDSATRNDHVHTERKRTFPQASQIDVLSNGGTPPTIQKLGHGDVLCVCVTMLFVKELFMKELRVTCVWQCCVRVWQCCVWKSCVCVWSAVCERVVCVCDNVVFKRVVCVWQCCVCERVVCVCLWQCCVLKTCMCVWQCCVKVLCVCACECKSCAWQCCVCESVWQCCESAK